MRICVIGNSQLAACKRGWDDIGRDYPSFELTFFGVLKDEIDNLSVAGTALVPQSERLRENMAITSKGKTEIAGDYDRYVLWGLYFRLVSAAKTYNDRRAEGVSNERDLMEAVKARLGRSPSIGIFRKLRAISNAPIALVPDPMMSEVKLSEHLEETVRKGEQQLVAGVFETAVRELGAELGFTPFFQPPQTLANPVQTNVEYSAGVTPSGTPDFYHGNRAFGALQLRTVLSSSFCDD